MADKVNVNRRTLLKSAAASITAGFGVAGASATAVAQPGRPAAREEAEGLFASQGQDVLSLLSDEGVLDRGEIAELSTDRPALASDLAGNIEGTAVFDRATDTDRLVSVTDVAGGTLSVAIELDSGRSYGILDDGDSLTVFDPDVGRIEDVEVQDNCSQYACPDATSCYTYSTVSYASREVTYDSCCSYYQCTDP